MKYKQLKSNRIDKINPINNTKCYRSIATSGKCLEQVINLKNKLCAIYEQVHCNL